MLLRSSDLDVVNSIKGLVYSTTLREFTRIYTKYGLTDEPIDYNLINKATENMIKELSSKK